MEGIMQAITSAAARVGWYGIGPAVALLICLANLGGVGAFLAALARIPFVVGIDRYLPPAFGRVHPKWGTPAVALVTQAVCCMVFILLGQAGSTVHGAYQVLVTMTIITNFVPYLFMFAAHDPSAARAGRGRRDSCSRRQAGRHRSRAYRHGDNLCRIVASVVPDPSEPNKVLAVAKVVFFSVFWLAEECCCMRWEEGAPESVKSSDAALVLQRRI